MKELVAHGKVNGNPVEVLCESKNGEYEFLFNGEKNSMLESKLRSLMRTKHRIGNYPPKTMKLNLYSILTGIDFFDLDERQAEVFGDIEEIPYQEGVVY